MSNKITLVIGKLLRKAENTDSPDEADALMAKAQALATRHSIDLAMARWAHADRERREAVEERTVAIGRPRQPHLVLRRRLFAAIAEVNDVTVLLRGTEAVLHPVGFTSDLDVVEAMHRSLDLQMTASADAWLRSGSTRLHGTTARGLFYEGFVTRVHARLIEARDAELWADDPSGTPITSRGGLKGSAATPRSEAGGELSSTALALRAKRREVDDFIASKYQRVGTRTTRSRGVRDLAEARAHHAGRSAAESARLTAQQSLSAPRRSLE